MTGTRPSLARTRPRNRRQLIVASAAELFARLGYHHVAMSQVAEEVGVRPSALYRHICGKQDLLYEVVHDALATIAAAVTDEEPVTAMAWAVLGNRRLGVLWQRESRHLEPQARQQLRAELVTAVRSFADYVGRRQPRRGKPDVDLLSWTVAAALMSVSFQRIELPDAEYHDLLAGIGESALTTDLTVSDHRSAPPRQNNHLDAEFRRDQLWATATRLFAEHGFAGVSMDDIGTAAGIAGPSIYHHFASKLDILAETMRWGAAELRNDLTQAIAGAAPPAATLSELIESYTASSLQHHHVMDLLITEVAQLPESECNTLRRQQRAYIAEWVRLLREIRPDTPHPHARVRVQAALNVINDTARTPHLRRQHCIQSKLTAIAHSLLGVSTGDP